MTFWFKLVVAPAVLAASLHRAGAAGPVGVAGTASSGNSRVTHGDATVTPDAAGNTITLRQPSRIEWTSFQVPNGQTWRYVSEGGRHASVNVVTGGIAAGIHGRIVADGPFHLISPAGIVVGPTGQISAPRVLLSALHAADDTALLGGGSTAFFPTDPFSHLVQIDGSVTAGAEGLSVLGSRIALGAGARLQAPGGKIHLAATTSGPVTGSTMVSPSTGGTGLIVSEGSLEAASVEFVSDGFIRNAGRLATAGPGNAVRLAAQTVTHENQPGSVISTSKLTVQGVFRQDGPVFGADDGSTPAGISGIRQTPRLSKPGFITTVEARPGQLATAPLQTVRTVASPLPPPLPTDDQGLAVRRRGVDGSERGEKAATVAGAAPKPARSVKKASFFGKIYQR